MNVKGKVVIVTASTRGIGWACVQAFVREGAIALELATKTCYPNRKHSQERVSGCKSSRILLTHSQAIPNVTTVLQETETNATNLCQEKGSREVDKGRPRQ